MPRKNKGKNKKGKRASRNRDFTNSNSRKPDSDRDLITGNWTWDGGDVVTGYAKSGQTKYQTYFGVLETGIGNEVSFSGYGDSNGNGIFDRGQDVNVGSASLNVFATSPQGLLEVCPSRPGSLAAATVSCAGTALQPCRSFLTNLPPLAT